MKKTTLYLGQDLDQALTHAAAKQRIAKAEFVRRALARAVEGDLAPGFGAVGVFDGPADLARDADGHLADGFGER